MPPRQLSIKQGLLAHNARLYGTRRRISFCCGTIRIEINVPDIIWEIVGLSRRRISLAAVRKSRGLASFPDTTCYSSPEGSFNVPTRIFSTLNRWKRASSDLLWNILFHNIAGFRRRLRWKEWNCVPFVVIFSRLGITGYGCQSCLWSDE